MVFSPISVQAPNTSLPLDPLMACHDRLRRRVQGASPAAADQLTQRMAEVYAAELNEAVNSLLEYSSTLSQRISRRRLERLAEELAPEVMREVEEQFASEIEALGHAWPDGDVSRAA